MGIYKGRTDLSNALRGNTELSAIYKGNKEIWSGKEFLIKKGIVTEFGGSLTAVAELESWMGNNYEPTQPIMAYGDGYIDMYMPYPKSASNYATGKVKFAEMDLTGYTKLKANYSIWQVGSEYSLAQIQGFPRPEGSGVIGINGTEKVLLQYTETEWDIAPISETLYKPYFYLRTRGKSFCVDVARIRITDLWLE